MLDSSQGNKATWLSVIIPATVLVGSIITAFYAVDKRVAILELENTTVTKSYTDLDQYQRFLQRQMEANDRKILVLETKQQTLEETQQVLSAKVDSILNKLETVGNTLVRIQAELEGINNRGK